MTRLRPNIQKMRWFYRESCKYSNTADWSTVIFTVAADVQQKPLQSVTILLLVSCHNYIMSMLCTACSKLISRLHCVDCIQGITCAYLQELHISMEMSFVAMVWIEWIYTGAKNTHSGVLLFTGPQYRAFCHMCCMSTTCHYIWPTYATTVDNIGD